RAHKHTNKAVHCDPQLTPATMAQYYSEVDYCPEERSRPYANPGFCHGEGGERYAVRKEAYEEVDEMALAGRGHQHHGHLGRSGSHSGHLAHSGSHLGHLGHEGHHEHLGHREHHGHGGRRYDSCTGEYYA
ncbi:hypothetical protein P5E51_15905, partial [Clostridium perfringens]|nr:hypothetical protein [Clostridium perfringens]